MYKILSLIGIFFILSCGNENKSTADNKKTLNKNDKTNFADNKNDFEADNKKQTEQGENKPKIFDINGNEISFSSSSNSIIESKKSPFKNQNIKKTKLTYFLTTQRGFFSLGTSEPQKEIEDSLKSVLFFVKFSTGELSSTTVMSNQYDSLKEIIKDKNEIKKYDPNNFLSFTDLFKLEGTIEKKIFIVALGEKYNLNLKEDIIKATNLNQLLKCSFFELNYVREEIIERLKKSSKKFEKEINELENDKSLIKAERIEKFQKDFKSEIYKIVVQIVNEAKNFIPKIEFEIIEKGKIGSYKIQITMN